jgi:hypothetical protein
LVPSWWPTLYGGYEANLFYGAGITYVSCCDDKNVRWQYTYKKKCWGAAVGIALSGGHVTGMAKKKCDYRRYEGYFIEFKMPVISVDLGSDGVHDLGLGAGPNSGLMVCKYTMIDRDWLGCCN